MKNNNNTKFAELEGVQRTTANTLELKPWHNFTWFDSDYNSDSEEEWELITSETPDWFEDNIRAADYVIVQNEERRLIWRAAMLIIVCLIDIDVVVIVIEISVLGIIVH